MKKTTKLVYISLLIAQALALHIIEGMLPIPFVITPGARLGLSNIITVMALYTLSYKEAFFYSFSSENFTFSDVWWKYIKTLI